MTSIRTLIIDCLNKNDNKADFATIFLFVSNNKSQIRLNAIDPKKSVRGILSKMKKQKLISKNGLKFHLINMP